MKASHFRRSEVRRSSLRPWECRDLSWHQPLCRAAAGGQRSAFPGLLPSPRRPHETLDRFLVDKAEIDAFIERNKERERP